MDNIILTGFMGSGKSTVGRLLAGALGYLFADTDAWIEAQAGRPVSAIFAQSGEAAFRRWEELAALHFSRTHRHVVATGGRMVLDPANMLDLQRSGAIVCLRATPETIWRRAQQQGGQRPLLSVSEPLAEIRRLLSEREAGYDQFASVETDGRTPASIAEEIRLGMENGRWRRPAPELCRITVKFPGGQYPVIVGRELLGRLRELGDIQHALALVTDENVGPLHSAACAADTTITVPAGEEYKNLATVQQIYDQMLAAGLDRSATLASLGGGVVGDMGGFAAATYMRGISFLQCPTTVLSMVDASVGAKTGVDLPQGKNLVGAFKQPVAVLADVGTLETLPPVEFRAGMAEVVKHGLLASPALLDQIEVLDRSVTGLMSMLLRAIQVKQQFVEADPFEQGQRATLNLGHTFGHAIEQVSGYRIRHGEGVAMGMVCAAHLSARLGHCAPGLQLRVEDVLTRQGLPTRLPMNLDAEALVEAMGSDKKKRAGRLRFVLLREVGHAFITSEVPLAKVLETLRTLRA